MKAIAWDTSSKIGTLAAFEWDSFSKEGHKTLKLVSEWTLNNELAHSERLLWGIHRLLEAARWNLSDLNLLGVGLGPGSFTGIRIGVTTARTLGQALGLPLLGFSSLVALTRGVAQDLALTKEGGRVLIAGAMDACKGELFSVFGTAQALADCVCKTSGDDPGLWKRGVEEDVYEHDVLIKELKRRTSDSKTPGWIVLGEAYERYPDLFAKLPKKKHLTAISPFNQIIQGRVMAQMVWEGFQAGLAKEALSVRPRYLRVADAEKKLNQRLAASVSPPKK